MDTEKEWGRLLGAWALLAVLTFKTTVWISVWLYILAGAINAVSVIVRQWRISRRTDGECVAWMVISLIFILLLLPKAIKLTRLHFMLF